MSRSFAVALWLGCLLALVSVVQGEPPVAPELLPVALRSEPAAAPELLSVASRVTNFDPHGDPVPDGALARYGTLRLRHGEALRFVAFAAEGKELVTSAADGWVRVWDRSTGKELRRIAHPSQNGRGSSSSAYSDGVMAVVRIGDHREQVQVALTPDGRSLALAATSGNIQMYNLATGQKGHTIRGGNYATIVFSPDSKMAVVKDMTGAIHLWDVAAGKELRQLAKAPDTKRRFFFGRDGGKTLAFSPDSKVLAVITASIEENQQPTLAIKLLQTDTGKELQSIKELGQNFFSGMSLAFAPDGKTVAFANYDGIIRLFDADTGKPIRQLGQQQFGNFPGDMIFLPDGKTLAAKIHHRPTIQLWDYQAGKELRTLGEPTPTANGNVFFGGREMPAQEMALTPDGKVLAMAGSESAARLWDVETGKELHTVTGHGSTVTALCVAPDGRSILTGGTCSTARRWDLETGKELRQVPLQPGAAHIAFSADGRLAAFGVAGNKVVLWDLNDNKGELHTLTLATLQNATIGGGAGMAFAPDGKSLAIKDYNGEMRLFETETGNEVKRFSLRGDLPGLASIVYVNGLTPGIAYAADGRFLATIERVPKPGADPNSISFDDSCVIRLWNPATGKMVCQSDAAKSNILAVGFAPDGRSLASAHADGTIVLWEAATGKERTRWTLKGAAGNVIGKALALMGGGASSSSDSLGCLAFSADGRTLAAGCEDRAVHLWDVRSGKKLGNVVGHLGGVRSVCFTPDGRHLISAGTDTTALRWDVSALIARNDATDTELAPAKVEALGRDLAGTDAAKAFQALNSLLQSPRQAVAWLQGNVQPLAPVDDQRLQQMIADLDSAQFAKRQQAELELGRLGELAEPTLQTVLQGKPTLEIRQRVEGLLSRLGGSVTDADTLRTLRAIELLEAVGTTEARQVLEKLGTGAAGARVTREAKASLERLARLSGTAGKS